MKRSLFGLSGAAILIAMVLLPLVVMVVAPGRVEAQDLSVSRTTTIFSDVDSCTTSWDTLATGAGSAPFDLIINHDGQAGQILLVAFVGAEGATSQIRVLYGDGRLIIPNVRATTINTASVSGSFSRRIAAIKR